MSLMDTSTQERLVESMCTEQHLKNMAMFLAAITKFKGVNWETIKRVTQSECTEQNSTLKLSRYAIQMVYKIEDFSLLEGHSHYTYHLIESTPLSDLTALGYCIATSNYKWKLQLGSRFQGIKTITGVNLLLHALHHHSSNSYTIESIRCYYVETEVAQQLLSGLPHHTLPLIKTLVLSGPLLRLPFQRLLLPQCLPELIHKMNKFRVLKLQSITKATLSDTLQALAAAPTCTLEMLDLSRSKFSTLAIQALHCALLGNRKSMTELLLWRCDISDEQACQLATALNRLPEIRVVDLSVNTIGDEGAVAIADALKRLLKLRKVDLSKNKDIRDEGAVAIVEALNKLPELIEVDLSRIKAIGRGREVIEEWKKTIKQVELHF